MHISITGATALILTMSPGPIDITIDTDDEHAGFGPLHMLAASLATCSASVLAAYAETTHQEIEATKIELSWEYVDDPYRVGNYTMTVHWPHELSAGRQKALLRVVEQCTVHSTLTHPPTIHAHVVVPTES